MSSSNECPICLEKYTVQLRKVVKCQYCEYSACSVCCKRYITEGVLDAHCMSCRRGWNDEFLDSNFTKAFRTGSYKKHRETLLFEREMAILPTRQYRVEATFKMRDAEKELGVFHKELEELDRKRNRILSNCDRAQRKITRYEAESKGLTPPAWTLGEGKGGGERAKFIMKCPDGECRGFLSSAYKCGTCQKWACPHCLVIKGNAPHTCDPALKESVALIIKDTRPCPKCGERISKIDGCAQMWCVECHTAFDWNTGNLVNGVIHNPHYYEFLRKEGNGVAPRNAGDVPCGGVPWYHHLQEAIVGISATRVQKNELVGIHRITQEITDYRIQAYQGRFNVNDNGDLGVAYLLKEMDKEAMKAELIKRETKRNKQLAIREVLEMFVNTSTIMLNNIVNESPTSSEQLEHILEEFRNLRKYVNESLLRISRMKGCSVPLIGENWEWKPFNKAPSQKRSSKKEEVKEEVVVVED